MRKRKRENWGKPQGDWSRFNERPMHAALLTLTIAAAVVAYFAMRQEHQRHDNNLAILRAAHQVALPGRLQPINQ